MAKIWREQQFDQILSKMFGKEITGHSQVEPRNSLVSLLIEKNFGQKNFLFQNSPDTMQNSTVTAGLVSGWIR